MADQPLILRLMVLGPPEVRIGENPVTFPTRKTQALLIYLAIEAGSQPRDHLASLLWPNSNAALSRASLRNTVNRLQSSLRTACGGVENSFLQINNTSISLDGSALIDLDLRLVDQAYDLINIDWSSLSSDDLSASLEKLRQAADCVRGNFLTGFSLGDAPEFDDWVSIQREEWHRKLGSVLDRLSELQFSRGEFSEALSAASKWISIDPLNETAYRRKMRIHFAAGERAKALEVYDTCRVTLSSELGIEPEPDTEALAERIRTQVSPGHTRRIISHDQPGKPLTSVDFLGSLFTGRSNETQALVNCFELAAAGQPQLVIMRGEAGIGKTRLAEKFLAWTNAHGSELLRGGGFESGIHFPFQPLIDAIRIRFQSENDFPEQIEEEWLSIISQLLPERHQKIRGLPPEIPELGLIESSLAQPRLFESLVQLTLRLAQKATLVILMDDIQWADSATLDWLHFALRRWRDSIGSSLNPRIMLLVSLRIEGLYPAVPSPLGENQSSIIQWLTRVEREVNPVQIDLEPLAEPDMIQLIYSILSPPSENFAQWLYAETHGHPFYMVETLKDFLERRVLRPKRQPDGQWTFSVNPQQNFEESARIPSSVYSVIRSRLNRISPNAFGVLAAAAVLEQQITFEHLIAIANINEDMALPAVDELISSRLMLETGVAGSANEYVFVNDMLRDVVYTEAGEARRKLFHRRALEILDAEGSSEAVLAHHALSAGLMQDAFRRSLAAGKEALRLSAVNDAVVHFERALQLVRDGSLPEFPGEAVLKELHRLIGRAYKLAGQPEMAAEIDAELNRLTTEHEKGE